MTVKNPKVGLHIPLAKALQEEFEGYLKPALAKDISKYVVEFIRRLLRNKIDVHIPTIGTLYPMALLADKNNLKGFGRGRRKHARWMIGFMCANTISYEMNDLFGLPTDEDAEMYKRRYKYNYSSSNDLNSFKYRKKEIYK